MMIYDKEMRTCEDLPFEFGLYMAHMEGWETPDLKKFAGPYMI